MKNMNNKYSFIKEYTRAQQIAIDTRLRRIMEELVWLGVGPCAFKLNDDITCVYGPKKNCVGDYFAHIGFEYHGHEDATGRESVYFDEYFAKGLFVLKFETEFKKEIMEARKASDEYEKALFDITYTEDDGIETILNAIEAGADIDITPYLEKPQHMDEEIAAFINHGYAFDLYLEDGASFDTKIEIAGWFEGHLLELPDEGRSIVEQWVKDNPDKCILAKNRHPETANKNA